MRLVTFNVLHGASPDDDVVDLDRFAAAVVALDPDVLALQEVDRARTARTAPTSPTSRRRRWGPRAPASWPR